MPGLPLKPSTIAVLAVATILLGGAVLLAVVLLVTIAGAFTPHGPVAAQGIAPTPTATSVSTVPTAPSDEATGEALAAGLFSEVDGDAPSDTGGTTLASRLVGIDFRQLSQVTKSLVGTRDSATVQSLTPQTLVLNLFDDVTFTGIVEHAEPTSSGYTLWGGLEGVELGTMTLVVSGSVVVGTVRTPDAVYTIRTAGADKYVVRQIDESSLPPSGEPLKRQLPGRDAPPPAPPQGRGPAEPVAPDGISTPTPTAIPVSTVPTAPSGEATGEILVGGLFSEVDGDAPSDTGGTTLASRLVGIDFRQLSQVTKSLVGTRDSATVQSLTPQTLLLNLFDDVTFTGIVEHAEPTSSGYTLWGGLEGVELGTMTLVVNGSVVVGTVRTPDAVYTIRTAGADKYVVRQIDESSLPPSGEPLKRQLPGRDAPPPAPPQGRGPTEPVAPDGTSTPTPTGTPVSTVPTSPLGQATGEVLVGGLFHEVDGSVVVGMVRTPDAVYSIRTAGDDKYVVRQIDVSWLPPPGEPLKGQVPGSDTPPPAPPQGRGPAEPVAPDGTSTPTATSTPVSIVPTAPSDQATGEVLVGGLGGLFSELDGEAPPSIGVGALASRLVGIDFGQLSQVTSPPVGPKDSITGKPTPQTLVLNLFDDAVFTGTVQYVGATPSGHTLSGKLGGVGLGTFTLVVNGSVVVGTVRTPGAVYSIRTAGDGKYVVRQIDESSLPPVGEPLEGPLSTRETQSESDDDPPDDGSVIDVVVLYTPETKHEEGGRAAVEALIDLFVAETNQANANSGVTHRIRLVLKEEVDYADTGTFVDINRLVDDSDGSMDHVHELRDAYAADLVHLLISQAKTFVG